MSKKILIPTTLLVGLMSLSPAQTLTEMEQHSLTLARKFIYGKDKSFYRPDGGVVFLHGGTMPSVLTAPLKLTDIQLQPGEIIKEIQLGDTVRWQVAPSLSGNGDTQVSHVVVKPTDSGLATTLDIFTDLRSYHINLKSTKISYFPVVSFGYSDELKEKWDAYQKGVHTAQLKKTMQVNGVGGLDVTKLDFNYVISGNASFKPTRIFNDGRKTYIQMPSDLSSREAPILLALDPSGSEKIVNYRVSGNQYIVDQLFSEAILIAGIGISQSKIKIKKSGARTSNLSILDGGK